MFEKLNLTKNTAPAINTWVEILERIYIRAKDETKLQILFFFLRLMKIDVTRAAQRTIKRIREKKRAAFPLARDVQNCVRKLKSMAKEALLVSEEDPESYQGSLMLSCSLLTHVVLFNTRRSREGERIMLTRSLNIQPHEAHEDVLDYLSEMEKCLLETLVLLKTPGKGQQSIKRT